MKFIMLLQIIMRQTIIILLDAMLKLKNSSHIYCTKVTLYYDDHSYSQNHS